MTINGRSGPILISMLSASIYVLVAAQLRWFYTGMMHRRCISIVCFLLSCFNINTLSTSGHTRNQVQMPTMGNNSRRDSFRASGATFHCSDLFHPTSEYILYYGGVVLRRKTNESAIPRSEYHMVESMLSEELLGYKNRIGSRMARVVELTSYTMLISPNYAAFPAHQANISTTDLTDVLYQAEVGLYDADTRQFHDRRWSDMTVGDLHVATLAVSGAHQERSVGNDATYSVDAEGTILTLVSAASDSELLGNPRSIPAAESHKVIFTSDHRGQHSLYSHTWHSIPDSAVDPQPPPPPPKLRIMTFNLWHNNPPHWIYPDQLRRRRRYEERMKHFADIVAEEDPDIIAIQEVRLDASFVAMDGRLLHWSDAQLSKHDGGSQVEHVLTHLAQARTRACHADTFCNSRALNRTHGDYYHVLFQPAMSMIDLQKPSQRNEEGLLILSKAELPIVDFSVQLLPRDMTDPSDDHQRVVLKADIRVPSRFVGRGGGEVCLGCGDAVLQVITSHFSLSGRARDLAVRHIARDRGRPGVIQVRKGLGPHKVLT